MLLELGADCHQLGSWLSDITSNIHCQGLITGFSALPGNLELPGIWTYCLEVVEKPCVLKNAPRPGNWLEFFARVFFFKSGFRLIFSIDDTKSLRWKLTWNFTTWPWKLPWKYLNFHLWICWEPYDFNAYSVKSEDISPIVDKSWWSKHVCHNDKTRLINTVP